MLRTFLAIVAALMALQFSTPVFALTGVQAAEKCLTTPGCSIRWNGDGSFDITTAAGGLITCADLSLECIAFRAGNGLHPLKKRGANEYVVPQSLLDSGSGGGGDTGVPGTASGGGGGKQLGSSFPTRGPTTPGVIQ